MNKSLTHIIQKTKNRFHYVVMRAYKYIDVGKLSFCGIDELRRKSALVERLRMMLGDMGGVLQCRIEEKSAILKAADRVVEHKFDLLGSGEIQFGEKIEWSRELKTGYIWPKNTFYRQIRPATPKGSDIKMPWELSRCHHLLILGEAYTMTGDERYAREVVDEMSDWIIQNPLMYSVNWTCAMDVSIRAVNWMYALLFIEKSESFDDAFARKVYRSLYQHLFFVSKNLEKSIPYSNNHYVSDIAGLLFLGTLFKTTARGRKQLRFAVKEYCRETLIQIFPSGVDYERSTSYHRLMTELLVYSRNMLVRTGVKLPEEVDTRLSKMLNYVGQYTFENGRSPIVADNDNGRFLPFVPRDFREHGYLLTKNSLEYVLTNTGITPISVASDYSESRLYGDANTAILKRSGKYLFVSCCDRFRADVASEKYQGTHIHNDLLSFVYTDGVQEVIVDAGAYVYTSDVERHNEFRSARKHNTIIVDDEEQNILSPSSAFLMTYNADAAPLQISKSSDSDICEGSYITKRGGMNHQRRFVLSDPGLEISDVVRKTGSNHKLYMSFHFAAGIETEQKNGCVELTAGKKKYSISVDSQNELSCYLKDDTISPSYGVLQQSKILVVEAVFDDKISVKTQIKDIHNEY